MLLVFAQLREHVRQLHGLIDIQRLHKVAADVRVGIVEQRLVKAVEIQYADDIVDAVLIHGDARIRQILAREQKLAPVVVNIERLDVHARGHHVHDGDLGKVERAAQKLAAILVDDALVLNGLNDGLQLGGGFLLGIFAAVLVLERKRNKTDEQRNEEDDRREHDHKKTDERRDRH